MHKRTGRRVNPRRVARRYGCAVNRLSYGKNLIEDAASLIEHDTAARGPFRSRYARASCPLRARVRQTDRRVAFVEDCELRSQAIEARLAASNASNTYNSAESIRRSRSRADQMHVIRRHGPRKRRSDCEIVLVDGCEQIAIAGCNPMRPIALVFPSGLENAASGIVHDEGTGANPLTLKAVAVVGDWRRNGA